MSPASTPHPTARISRTTERWGDFFFLIFGTRESFSFSVPTAWREIEIYSYGTGKKTKKTKHFKYILWYSKHEIKLHQIQSLSDPKMSLRNHQILDRTCSLTALVCFEDGSFALEENPHKKQHQLRINIDALLFLDLFKSSIFFIVDLSTLGCASFPVTPLQKSNVYLLDQYESSWLTFNVRLLGARVRTESHTTTVGR